MLLKKNSSSNFIVSTILMCHIIILFFCVIISNKLNAQENENKISKSFPSVEIPGTQLCKIHSSIVDQEYELHINLPRDFPDTSKTFPIVYLLDSQWDFPLVSAIYGEQYFDGFLPSLIIVGITWGGEKPNPDTLRARDFTPTTIDQGGLSGNAGKFFEFIEKELMPFMEINYRASKNDRVLMGSSLGGLFTLYSLFNHTHVFNKYILTSPALDWDNGITYKYEQKYAEKESKLQKKVYMAFGEYEVGVSAFNRFVAQIEERKYTGLDLRTKILDGIGHSGTKAEGYTRGLQFVFAKPSLNLDDTILKQYTGTYEMDNKLQIYIATINNKLELLTPDNSSVILQAETENDYYVKGQFLKIHFKKDESVNVLGFQLQSYGGVVYVKRIN